MRTIFVNKQSDFDALNNRVEKDQEVFIDTSVTTRLTLNVFGALKIRASLSGGVVVARGNASVEARGNASVEARENASVEAWENASVEAGGNASVVAWGNASVEAWGNASVVAGGNASVEARGNASVEARGNASVVAWENASVEARENASVVAWENASVKLLRNYSLRVLVKLFGFSVVWKPKGEDIKIEIKSPTAHVQEFEQQKFLDREGVEIVDGKVVLYKRVSHDYKTQEATSNETLWKPGTTLEHHNWCPTNGECGEGKYHACSRPYFCDEFRSTKGDQYVAIEVAVEDLFEWEDGEYPHKIAFRKGTVLYNVDRFGKKAA